MDGSSFLFWVAVAVCGSLIVAGILGAMRWASRYVTSVVNDFRAAFTALREERNKDADAHEKRAIVKMAGGMCLGLFLQVLFLLTAITALIVELVQRQIRYSLVKEQDDRILMYQHVSYFRS